MITTIDPLLRLKHLAYYMSWWVDHWPRVGTFDQFLQLRYPQIIPGTVEHARAQATHCFYCGTLFSKIENDLLAPSVDHYMPKSKGVTDKYVICCRKCNCYKGNQSPLRYLRSIALAELREQKIFGLMGKKRTFAFKQVQVISNDLLYNTGPKIYYIRK